MAREKKYPFRKLEWVPLDLAEQERRAEDFERRMAMRRTVREFSSRAGPLELIEAAIRVAGRAPSGANQQPWHFVVVKDPQIKHEIRLAAEAEEKESYERRMPDDWLAALEPLGTDWHKEFLEIAPYLIVVFREDYGIVRGADGTERKIKHYYVQESTGIACGFLLAALHWMGFATLTHTPSPMGFLSRILKRPANEKPYLLIPLGYPAETAEVPDIRKKSIKEILTIM